MSLALLLIAYGALVLLPLFSACIRAGMADDADYRAQAQDERILI